MAAYTGLILCGTAHPNDDGLLYHRAPRRLWLSENSSPAWSLDTTADAIKDGRRRKTVWIPKYIRTMIEDALLVIAAFVIKDNELRTALKAEIGCDELPLFLDLTKALNDQQHERLIHISRKASLGWPLKLIISVFHGSLLENRLLPLQHYDYDVEVLVPGYTRLYSRWLKARVIQGSLTALPVISNTNIIKDDE